MIKNFIFDMGEVLFHFRPKEFVARYNLNEDDANLLRHKIFEEEYWTMLDWGYTTEEELIQHVCKEVPERLHQTVRDLILRWDDPIIPIEGMADLVKDLKDRGYGIYLLSNAGPRHKEYFSKIPGSEYFDGIVVSSYEKLIKPDMEIFKLTLNRFGLKADECFFIDDNQANVCGARLVGIDGFVFTGIEDLKKVLHEKINY